MSEATDQGGRLVAGTAPSGTLVPPSRTAGGSADPGWVPSVTQVVWARGALDLATVDELGRSLARCALDQDVVVDLGAVTFLDCAGLRVLLDAAARWRRAGGRCRVRNARPPVARVLALTGTAAVLA